MVQLKENGLEIFKAIFDKKKTVIIDNVKYPISKFSSGIKYVDLLGHRYIEQNRRKKSEWGKKAREGHNIMWIIKERRYLARIMDGVYTDLIKNKK